MAVTGCQPGNHRETTNVATAAASPYNGSRPQRLRGGIRRELLAWRDGGNMGQREREVRSAREEGAAQELPVAREAFLALGREYLPVAPLRLLLVDAAGHLLLASGRCSCPHMNYLAQRHYALAEAVRWGEPVICANIPGRLLWAVPVMHNARITGGIIACADEDALFPDEGEGCFDLKAACDLLLELATRYNFCNAALLRQIREEHCLERQRAEAIHEAKKVSPGQIMQVYLQEEPELLRAVRAGRRTEAVAIINRLLTFIYSHAERDMSLVKSLLLELVSAMNRAAVEAGARPEEVFTRNFQHMAGLGAINGEEELSAWVRETLSDLLLTLRKPLSDEKGQLLRQLSALLNERCGDTLTREEVAAELDLSPGALSRFLKEQAGCGFSQMLARVRVGRAEKLLADTERPLMQIAYDCGFTDQSYFTRIFHQHTGLTPKEYRQRYAR